MARLYANENFPYQVVIALRALGHDVLTVQEAGNAGQGISDEEVLAFAIRHNRAVVTINRRDFIRLHRQQPDHAGIIVCTQDANTEGQAERIHQAIISVDTLTGQLLRVNRPRR
jgi:predicted nuclease of predicted toxin-antitoxin system